MIDRLSFKLALQLFTETDGGDVNWCNAGNVQISSIPKASSKTWQTRTAERHPLAGVFLVEFGRLLPIYLPRHFIANLAMLDEWLESGLARGRLGP